MCIYSTAFSLSIDLLFFSPLNIDIYFFDTTQKDSSNNQNIYKLIPSFFFLYIIAISYSITFMKYTVNKQVGSEIEFVLCQKRLS